MLKQQQFNGTPGKKSPALSVKVRPGRNLNRRLIQVSSISSDVADLL